MTEKQIAVILSVSVASIRRWRLVKQGPPYLKVGSSVRYSPPAVFEWLISRQGGGDLGRQGSGSQQVIKGEGTANS